MARNKIYRFALLGTAAISGCAPGTVTSGTEANFADESHRLLPSEWSTTDVRMLDLDADGDLDLVWASQHYGEVDEAMDLWELPGGVNISLNLGDATFVAAEIPADFRNWTFVEPCDIDSDGDPDLVFSKPSTRLNQISILRNDGDGRFSVADFPAVVGSDMGKLMSRVAAVDVDMDGDQDIIVPIFSSDDYQSERPNLLFLNDGSGAFALDTDGRIPAMEFNTDWTLSVAAADYDGDGDPDIVFGEAERQSRMLENDGNGFFQDITGPLGSPDARIPTAMARAYQAVPFDIDRDGDQDLVVVNDAVLKSDGPGIVSFGNYVLPNNGAGRFGLIELPAPARDSRGLALADVNGDGINDVVIGNAIGGVVGHEGEAISIYRGNGEEGYTPMGGLPRYARGVFGVAVGDLDGDGRVDIAGAVGVADESNSTSGDFSNILLLSR